MDAELIQYWYFTLKTLRKDERWKGYKSDLRLLGQYIGNQNLFDKIDEMPIQERITLSLQVPKDYYGIDYFSSIAEDNTLLGILRDLFVGRLHEFYTRPFFESSKGITIECPGYEYETHSLYPSDPLPDSDSAPYHAISKQCDRFHLKRLEPKKLGELRTELFQNLTDRFNIDKVTGARLRMGFDDTVLAIALKMAQSPLTDELRAFYYHDQYFHDSRTPLMNRINILHLLG